MLPGSFICCNFIHYHFRKVFCNILIQKFQSYSPRTRCLARICPYFRESIGAKNTVFTCFCGLLHPLSRSFFNRRVILWDWTRHAIKYLQMQWKILPMSLHTFSSNSLFFFYGSFSSAHFLFVPLQMLWFTLVFTPTDYINWLWNIKMMYWKWQNPRSCAFIKS